MRPIDEVILGESTIYNFLHYVLVNIGFHYRLNDDEVIIFSIVITELLLILSRLGFFYTIFAMCHQLLFEHIGT